MPVQLYTYQEAAPLLKSSVATLQRWKRLGVLVCHKPKGRVLIDVDATLEACVQRPLVDRIDMKIAQLRRKRIQQRRGGQ